MTWRERLTIWLRLLVLQAAWSYRRMQTLGWLWVAEPVANRRGQPAQILSASVIQFNTHSMLAPLLLGAAVSALDREQPDSEAAKAVLVRWMGTFGALGDMLYWQALAWNVVAITALAYLVAGPWGVLIMSSGGVCLEVAVRIFLFERGRTRPQAIANAMRRLATPKLRERLSGIAVLAMAPLAGVIFGHARAAAELTPELEWVAAFGAVIAAGLAVFTRFRSSVIWLPASLGLVYGLLLNN